MASGARDQADAARLQTGFKLSVEEQLEKANKGTRTRGDATIAVRSKWRGATRVRIHSIRHPSVTDVANPGIPVKVGTTLAVHKTVVIVMYYVHTEDKQVREAAEFATSRR